MTESSDNLVSGDGLRLSYRRWEAAQAKGVCLVTHGIAEHSGRYAGLAKALTEHGLSVWALDHRGHGRSQGRRGDCRTLGDYVQDLHRLLEVSLQATPTLPRILIGHSLGGLIALAFAVRFPSCIKGVAVSSPAFKLAEEPARIKLFAARLFSHLLPTVPIPNGVNPKHLCRDPQVVQDYRTDPLIHRAITARAAMVLRSALSDSIRLAGQLRIPVLMLQAGADRVCDTAAAERFARAVDPKWITTHRYEGLYHELFNEPERGRVMADLVRWTEKVLES